MRWGPVYTIERRREALHEAPAMPFSRMVARATAPFVQPGRLSALHFDRAYRRVAAGSVFRAVRFEIAERCFGDDLVVDIDPHRLDQELVDFVEGGGKPVRLSHWFLDSGDWTAALQPLQTSEVQREIDAIFDHEDRLEQSPAYRFLLSNSESGHPSERNRVSLTSPALIRSYFRQYRDLRESIERHGFQRRASVPRAATRLFSGTAVRGRAAESTEREIGVAVDPDGRLIRMIGGRHRTAIAQRLDLRRVPVQVRLVHAAWLGSWVARTGLPPSAALVAGVRHLADGGAKDEARG